MDLIDRIAAQRGNNGEASFVPAKVHEMYKALYDLLPELRKNGGELDGGILLVMTEDYLNDPSYKIGEKPVLRSARGCDSIIHTPTLAGLLEEPGAIVVSHDGTYQNLYMRAFPNARRDHNLWYFNNGRGTAAVDRSARKPKDVVIAVSEEMGGLVALVNGEYVTTTVPLTLYHRDGRTRQLEADNYLDSKEFCDRLECALGKEPKKIYEPFVQAYESEIQDGLLQKVHKAAESFHRKHPEDGLSLIVADDRIMTPDDNGYSLGTFLPGGGYVHGPNLLDGETEVQAYLDNLVDIDGAVLVHPETGEIHGERVYVNGAEPAWINVPKNAKLREISTGYASLLGCPGSAASERGVNSFTDGHPWRPNSPVSRVWNNLRGGVVRAADNFASSPLAKSYMQAAYEGKIPPAHQDGMM